MIDDPDGTARLPQRLQKPSARQVRAYDQAVTESLRKRSIRMLAIGFEELRQTRNRSRFGRDHNEGTGLVEPLACQIPRGDQYGSVVSYDVFSCVLAFCACVAINFVAHPL